MQISRSLLVTAMIAAGQNWINNAEFAVAVQSLQCRVTTFSLSCFWDALAASLFPSLMRHESLSKIARIK